MSTFTTSEMTPMNYMKIFFRRKELFIIPLVTGLVLGICTGILLPKEYESSTILLVEEGKSDNPLFDKLAVSTTVEQRLSTIRESMLGWNSLLILIKRLNMDKEVKTPQDLEELVETIRKKIDINLRGHNIIDLSYTDKDPGLTQAVVQNITDIFIERNVELQNKETADAIKFIEEQLELYRGKIKSAELAEIKDQLKVLLVDSTEAHPMVKQLRDQIKAKEEELRKENIIYTEEKAKLLPATTNPMIHEIKKTITTIEGTPSTALTPSKASDPEQEYFKLMLIDKLDNVMARDVDVNNQIYNMLLQRLETAKITQRLQSSKEGTKYTVIDPPRVPLKPAKPNRILIALGGLLLGGIIGFGLVVGAEFLDKSFIDVEEAKKFFGVPLLGAISKINTEASIRKEQERLSWLYSITVLAGIALIIVTVAVSNFIK